MAIRFRRHIKACGDGTLEVRLGSAERALLVEVADELTHELDQPDDPSLQRLFPPGYSEDAVRDAGYQMMMGDELRQRHLAAVRGLAATTGAEHLDPAQAESWLRSINAVRLVLGTRLGVTDDHQTVRISRDDPNLRSWVAYDFLSLLLDDLIAAMSI
ncbi:MAG TPA: DUF2017 family protein [Acidimicrobiales bacterium]|nr:DUF2017 family protein [Acidimicrobiales bacterium]